MDALNVLMQADQLKFLRFNISCEDLLKPEVRKDRGKGVVHGDCFGVKNMHF